MRRPVWILVSLVLAIASLIYIADRVGILPLEVSLTICVAGGAVLIGDHLIRRRKRRRGFR